MPTVAEIMSELEANGSESVKSIWLKHGIKEPFFGVKIAYLKNIQKRVKKNYRLAMELYATGNADAMYLAGLVTDDKQMSKADLHLWVSQALSTNINEFTVPRVAAESDFGYELGLEWIESKQDHFVSAGWATLSNYIALKPDNDLDLEALRLLLARVEQTIHTSPNRARQKMNSFVIAVGTYVKPLTDEAIATASRIGDVTVDMNGTACKVPGAIIYINKAIAKGVIGKKKKTVKC